LFDKEKIGIVAELGNLIELIEHVGSTAITNIVAKPIIDIAIMVKSFEQMNRIVKCFNEIGYEYKDEQGIEKRLYFVKSEGELSLFHVHVYEHGNSNFTNRLLFRDYINSNEKIKQSYSKLKLQLKEQCQDDCAKYTEGKAEFIKKQIKKANVKYQEYVREYNQPFKGWDFSYIKKRMKSEEIEWDYKEIIEPYISKCHCLLDMGTGGGEFLSSLKNLPSNIFATEGYLPNIEVARKKLSPLHITVMEVKEDGILNFRNHFFDLIINRHESYDVDEIHRVMTNNGTFITQQVAGNDCHEINDFLSRFFPIKYLIFSAMTLVFPVPAPATIRSGPSQYSTASV
jgi:GrpB-like predicted nucleotidyltransferase (UPF0157 family)